MNFLTAIFHGALAVVGFVEKEIGYIAQAGAMVRSLDLPPATHPGVYADVLKAIGFTEDQVAKIVGAGGLVAGIGNFVMVLQGAAANFQANQPVTGEATIWHPYSYAFTPKNPNP